MASSPHDPDRAAEDALALAERLAAEMALRWGAGERPLAEDYLAAHPRLADHPEAAAELIYEEVCLRREAGQEVVAEDILRRFPRWRGPLQVLLQCQRLLESAAAAPRFPAAGEVLAGFRLLAELGRGAQSRAFLATQAALGDRPVVLKVTDRDTQEHLSLARLQHTHIMPLYSAQEARGLLVLCMPYLGGTTLARLLESLRDRPPAQRSGADLLGALRQAQATAPVAVAVAGPACQFLAGASYVEAVCWMGACLAEALHAAHSHALVHLDVKPSNVLWAADGQPLLLDLHLARAPLAAGATAPDWLGGTPGYMAPEQEATLAVVLRGGRLPAAVDGRADLYSLGLVLFEALAGKLPAPGEPPGRQLRRLNPQVGRGLAGVLQRCLAADPGDRYPDAASLAADLRRHLAGGSLGGAADRSWARWRRRGISAAALVTLAFAVAAAGVLAALYAVRQRDEARAQLHEHQERARRAEAAAQLHRLVEHLHGLDSADELPPAARGIEGPCAAFWEQREQLASASAADLLELAVLWSDLHVRLAPAGRTNEARREALRVLDEAEQLLGASAALDVQRRSHATALGLRLPAPVADRPPRGAGEHVALGRARLRAGDLAAALAQFDRAVELEPQGLWPHFYRGRCAFRLGRHEDALLDFTACVALAPEGAWCWYNRGLAFEALGRSERALADYDHALRLDPALGLASLNRGMVYHRQGRSAEALADLRTALDHGAPPAAVYYDRALVYLARGDRSAARGSLLEALAHDPSHREARSLLASLGAKP
jgi:serine/threonine protein kinase/Tfp pilus assembly protein PilF